MKSSERTKEKIADAFCELASGKPISRISVREIAQKSGVTTVSFYHYFRDKYDLSVYIFVRKATRIVDRVGHDGYRWRDSFVFNVQQSYIQELSDLIRKNVGGCELTRAEEYAVKIYCAGTVQTVFEWLMAEKPISVEELALMFEIGLPKRLEGMLK
jgi:AcrR family transcriptional regulator